MSLLETIEVETGPAGTPAQSSVIWMHGLGADGHDFEAIVPELRIPRSLATRFVFPNAPMQPVTINNGYVMRAWYDVAFGDLEGRSRKPDEAGVRTSVAHIERLIAREVERGVPAARIAIAGFSQGGAIALATGLRHAQRLAGVMALSTYLPLGESLPAEASEANRQVPVFFAHGSMDPVIPIEMARTSVERLHALGYPVQWHEYTMQHSVHPQEIIDIRDWLLKVLGG
jgi:phospholipase/carboxylesterase